MPPTTTETMTLNAPWPSRRYSRPYAIVLSNTLSEKNLQIAGVPFKWLQNVGTSGLVMIAWADDNALVDIYMAQGQEIELGHAVHAKILGTTAGVELRGFRALEGVSY